MGGVDLLSVFLNDWDAQQEQECRIKHGGQEKHHKGSDNLHKMRGDKREGQEEVWYGGSYLFRQTHGMTTVWARRWSLPPHKNKEACEKGQTFAGGNSAVKMWGNIGITSFVWAPKRKV